MTGRGYEMDAEALHVVDGAVQGGDFNFAAVARAGVHFADMQRAPEESGGAGLICRPSSSAICRAAASAAGFAVGRERAARHWAMGGVGH